MVIVVAPFPSAIIMQHRNRQCRENKNNDSLAGGIPRQNCISQGDKRDDAQYQPPVPVENMLGGFENLEGDGSAVFDLFGHNCSPSQGATLTACLPRDALEVIGWTIRRPAPLPR